MNLIDAFMEDCVIVNKNKVSDGEGGFRVEWEEAAPIRCAIVNDTSMSARIAEREGVTSTYTITTSKDIRLEYHDYVKRVRDGKVFRVTSDAGDKVSPMVSNLDIAQVSAEKWELTT